MSVDPDLFAPTSILDIESEIVRGAFEKASLKSLSGLDLLRQGHLWITRNIEPIYTIDELQPVSLTLQKGKGSCSQRLAILEAFARSGGIPTRVRALWIAGHFWAGRFTVLRPFLPSEVLLAWPEFHLESAWMGTEELFGDLEDLAQQEPAGFFNRGESLFEALSHTAIDFAGQTRACGSGSCDLSQFLLRESGPFSSRDHLFEKLGSSQHSLRGRIFETFWGGRTYRQ